MTDVSVQLEFLKLLTGRLEKADIRYMVSGSTAMNFYAEPRMTRDIDIVVELTADDVPGLLAALGADFYVDEDTVRDAVERRSMFNAIHIAEALKADFIVRKDEPYRIEELSRRRRVQLADFALWAVAPEDLILSKLLWGKDSESELQLRDVRNLLAAATVDAEYLTAWATKLGIGDLLAKARA